MTCTIILEIENEIAPDVLVAAVLAVRRAHHRRLPARPRRTRVLRARGAHTFASRRAHMARWRLLSPRLASPRISRAAIRVLSARRAGLGGHGGRGGQVAARPARPHPERVRRRCASHVTWLAARPSVHCTRIYVSQLAQASRVRLEITTRNDNAIFFRLIDTLASSVSSTHGCYFVPAFSGLFCPYWRSDARGYAHTVCAHSHSHS